MRKDLQDISYISRAVADFVPNWGGLPDVFLKFEFQDDRSTNVGAVGVEICLFPLTRLIAYTTACSYHTSRDISEIFAYNRGFSGSGY